MSLVSRLSSALRSALRSPAARRAARDLGEAAVRAVREGREPRGARSPRSTDPHIGADAAPGALPDRSGTEPLTISYAPREDDAADPGEIVWAWVPFEEDLSQGKDRPVLVLAREQDRDGEVLIALMLTSRDRGRAVHVDEHGSTWVDIGTGAWDRQGRASEVRADRLLRIRPGSVRREGSRLSRERFERVADAVRTVHGWSA
ncbi:type II toxin-antitoxin system PemK/MazF family toxin [Brachybacterium hainanense]|uniref:Type II toxin-antitoxin system PemK/MazF family toxin n=1 Tax=Brachybacterium hainanense TaxID=1541174 RepID=A0ABV6RAA8_9MICO